MADSIVSQLVDYDTRASLGLAGTVDSLGYRVAEIEKHFHNSIQCYGMATNNMSRGALAPFQISAGNAAWSTELQLHDGTVIESGSTTKKFDLNTLFITAVNTANRLTYVEFHYGTLGTGVVCTFTNATERINKVGHGLSNGNKVMFGNSGGALPSGLVNYIVYYVVNKNNDDFQVSLTEGGAAVTFSDDGSGTNSYYIPSQTKFTETYISFASTTDDSFPYPVLSPRIYCNQRIWVRAKAAGGTNTVDLLIGLHTYIG
jgi:hypothetical protein